MACGKFTGDAKSDGLWGLCVQMANARGGWHNSPKVVKFPGATGQQNFRYRTVPYNAVLEGGIPLHEAYIQLTYSLHG